MNDTRDMLEAIGSLSNQLDIAEREIEGYRDRLAEAEAKVERMRGVVEEAKKCSWYNNSVINDLNAAVRALKALEDENE